MVDGAREALSRPPSARVWLLAWHSCTLSLSLRLERGAWLAGTRWRRIHSLLWVDGLFRFVGGRRGFEVFVARGSLKRDVWRKPAPFFLWAGLSVPLGVCFWAWVLPVGGAGARDCRDAMMHGLCCSCHVLVLCLNDMSSMGDFLLPVAEGSNSQRMAQCCLFGCPCARLSISPRHTDKCACLCLSH